ncbi:conserved protein of unknown function [Modestobacter italicus]|uniref:Uncharacterized protein n=1 Tax=Modestobacter italicus (strain DSM 44449 / CECT 9708 / BC 501) TaxID=2732864 RepID=I4EXM3_MODI5|nr:hypothetical protein [Modestobacter marinus]CCH88136.1 conserved protein of unknown function [Modestobacter marinus]
MVDDLVDLDRRIVQALAVLRGARARAAHAPSSEARWREVLAERALDDLLDRRPLCQMRQQARSLAG